MENGPEISIWNTNDSFEYRTYPVDLAIVQEDIPRLPAPDEWDFLLRHPACWKNVAVNLIPDVYR